MAITNFKYCYFEREDFFHRLAKMDPNFILKNNLGRNWVCIVHDVFMHSTLQSSSTMYGNFFNYYYYLQLLPQLVYKTL